MTNAIIGVLGVTGHVGQELLTLLKAAEQHPPVSIRLGGRNLSSYDKSCYECVTVDLADTDSLSYFCQGCSVIVNCAGPSALYGEAVMQAAVSAGAHCIDAFGGFGDESFHAITAMVNQAPTLTLVTGVGVFPGLSEVLPKAIASHYFDQVEHLLVAAGGLEPCSWAGGSDLLASAIAGYGSTDGKDRDQLMGFPAGIIAKPYQSNDFKRLAHSLCCEDETWYSVFSSDKVPEVIALSCHKLAAERASGMLTAPMLTSAVKPLIAVAEQELVGRQTWYRMMVEVYGKVNGESACHRAILSSTNSYGLTAYMLYHVLLQVLAGSVHPGHYPADEVVDCYAVYASLLTENSERSNLQYHLSHVILPGITNSESEEGAL